MQYCNALLLKVTFPNTGYQAIIRKLMIILYLIGVTTTTHFGIICPHPFLISTKSQDIGQVVKFASLGKGRGKLCIIYSF